jgi:hypothetical protein
MIELRLAIDEYPYRLSFDEWVGSQGDLSNNDHANVAKWLRDVRESGEASKLFAIEFLSVDQLVDIVC